MSGHKRATVNISQEEYDRLREAEVQLKALPAPKAEVIDQIHQESQEGLRSSIDWVAHRQDQFLSLVSGFGDHLRELESTTSRTILEHQQRLHQALDQRDGAMWVSVLQVLERSSQELQSEIINEHQRQQDQLTRFERRLGRMAGDLARKVEFAAQWLEASEQLCRFIHQHYNHGFFLPGQVDRLERQLAVARENLELGMPEAVLVTAQQVYMEFSRIRVDLENLENEWQVLYCAVWEAACNLQAVAAENQITGAVDLDGRLVGVDLDVDFWANGEVTNILSSLEEVFQRLEDTANQPGSAELHSLLTSRIPALQDALQEAVLAARVSAINSQLRINIADLVVQALQEQGFSLEAGSYQGVDMRQGYVARMVNFEGSEVEVQVAPFGQGLGENELHLRSLDERFRTEHELLQRWREINRSLARRGLAVRQPEVLGAAVPAGRSVRDRRGGFSTRSQREATGI